ncbi:hypothetical protein DM02DRAFT_702807, partial [Periconia macrospinosa]
MCFGSLVWDYYYPETWRSNGTWRLQSPIDVAHRSHCLSMLLQHLTCQPSLNVITHNWLDGYEIKPFPDFSIQRKCLDHDQILNWQEDVSLPFTGFTYPSPDEGIIVPASPEWQRVFGLSQHQ